jgi:hypothetical protein
LVFPACQQLPELARSARDMAASERIKEMPHAPDGFQPAASKPDAPVFVPVSDE